MIAIVLIAAIIRWHHATNPEREEIEKDEFIPAAMTLSAEHLPLRVSQHGALPAYLIRFSGTLFGHTLLGFRTLSVIVGTTGVLLIYLIGRRWWGDQAGVFSAALLAVERYNAEIAGRAVDLPFDLFFVTVALYCFSRFLHSLGPERRAPGRPRWLYGFAVAAGLGFLCKELTALLVLAAGVSFISLRMRQWATRKEPWIALLLFAVVISPDVHAAVTTTTAERLALRDLHIRTALEMGVTLVPGGPYEANGLFMSYGDQLSRFQGIGFNLAPFYFYFGDIFDWLGIPNDNGFEEFPYMHPVAGVALWLGVAYWLMRRNKDAFTVAMLTMFFAMFLPFTLARLQEARGDFPTDPAQLFYWVDRTMFPALLLAGSALSHAVSRPRAASPGTAIE